MSFLIVYLCFQSNYPENNVNIVTYINFLYLKFLKMNYLQRWEQYAPEA